MDTMEHVELSGVSFWLMDCAFNKHIILQYARDLRHPLTPAERKVWAAVRNRRLGYKIRRQHPISRFIADFYCAEAKLVIEIDGDTHAEPAQAEYDAARTAWLEAHGHHVIRFSNREVYENLDGVLEAIREACERLVGSPHPGPLPGGEGGRVA
jgi:very-short-patch-repair endonuclease